MPSCPKLQWMGGVKPTPTWQNRPSLRAQHFEEATPGWSVPPDLASSCLDRSLRTAIFPRLYARQTHPCRVQYCPLFPLLGSYQDATPRELCRPRMVPSIPKALPTAVERFSTRSRWRSAYSSVTVRCPTRSSVGPATCLHEFPARTRALAVTKTIAREPILPRSQPTTRLSKGPNVAWTITAKTIADTR